MGLTTSSRRSFLKQSAAACAVLTGLSVARSAHAQGSGSIKIGLIGCGGRGLGAAKQALETGKDVKLVAVGDYFKSKAQRGLENLRKALPEQVDVPAEQIFDGFQNDLGVIASEADVILIACAAKFHPLYTKRAIEAGKHVFVEKPNAIDAAGIHMLEEAVAIARKKGLSFLAGLHSRYQPQYQEIIEQIHNGVIGEIRAMQCNYLRAPYGIRGSYEGISELDFQVYNQYVFHWLSGDDFIQSLIHNLDRMFWALNGKLPTAAYGMGGRAASFGHKYGNVFDHHSVVFEFGNDNCILTAACRTQTGCYNNASDYIFGTKGMTDWRVIRGETQRRFQGAPRGGHAEEQVALFDALRKGERIDSGDYVVNSTMMGILGQMACYTGQKIMWKDLYDSKFVVKPAPEECIAGMDPPVVPGPDGLYPVPIPGQPHAWW